MRLNESQARAVLWIKAIEENDPQGMVFTRAQRFQASREARAGAGEFAPTGNGMAANEQFVVGRAEILQAAFRREFPGQDENLIGMRWRAGHLMLLLCLALAAGFFANHFGPERRISILAFPLLGVLAWNVAVYLVLLIRTVAALTRKDSAVVIPGFLTRWLLKATRPRARTPAREPEKGAVVSSSLKQFQQEWHTAALPLYGVRLRLALHLGSAFLALGILSGMYLRGLGYEYQAGWESTFLEADAVHRIVSVVLGPASVLTGIPIPGVEQMEQMRWRAGHPGEKAAPWIHLYAATALLVVLVPRLALAFSAFLRLRLWQNRFPTERLKASGYFRKLSTQRPGRGASVRVAPYNYAVDGQLKEALCGLFRDCLGWSTDVAFMPVTAYGEEDALLEGLAGSDEPAADYLVVLFNLAATPEKETHGRLLGGLRELVQEGETGQRLLVLVDASPYRARFFAQEFFEQRRAERLKAWKRLAENHGLGALAVDLEKLPADFSCDLLEETAWSPTPARA